MAEPFSMDVQSQDGFHVLALRGELDSGTSVQLAQELDRLVAAGTPVVVDLSALSFIDSGGLHALMKPRPSARISVVCPPGNVSRVMSVVRLEHVLPLYERLDDAVAAIG
ncbi:MAG TPA: STAS domain-containing protein [Gaiellaceae bacterium]|nr:STAS domain-containing protein [Gaiellaceae bacterium]